MNNKRLLFTVFSSFLVLFLFAQPVFAAEGNGLIDISIGDKGDMSESVKVFLLVALLSLAPSILIMFTCFTQVIIVLGLTRQALGTMTIPPNQVLTGLALFITLFIMSPVIQDIDKQAYQPYKEEKITMVEAFEKAEKPIKEFMVKNTYDKDLKMFLKIRGEEKPKNVEEVSLLTVIPAYSLSQMEKGILIGLSIYIIYTCIDILVGSILMFMGMMMLPPQMISLPLKLLVFVFIGGFSQVIDTLLNTIKV